MTAGTGSSWPLLGGMEGSGKAVAGLRDDGRVLRVPARSRPASKVDCAPAPVRTGTIA